VKILRTVLIFGVILILQSTLVQLVAVEGFRPDLILLALFFVAFMEGSYAATIAGFCVGLVQDMYAPQSLGLNALCKSIIGFALGFCQRGVFVEGLIPRSLILFAAVAVHDLLYFVISFWPDVGSGLSRALTQGIPTALYTAILGYVVFYFIHRKEQLQPLQEVQ
jgi:rod shape-determining protein MreD